ncbi:MAG: [protein-PII] uridylyltransferase [Ilumatobacteraceae bacterium]
MARPLNGPQIKRGRAGVVARPDLAGRTLAVRLAQQADAWFDRLAVDLPVGWALMATGGYAGRVLCPGSDIDVVLLHPPRAMAAQISEIAEKLWYPLWDGGVKLSPAVHSPKSLLALAADDLVTATSILRVRHLAGSEALVSGAQQAAVEQWRRRSNHWLQELLTVSRQRWERFGEVAALLEPDLKDGRGGLRDRDALRWALAVERDDISAALESPVDQLAAPAELLLTVRCELHRVTARATNRLLLQDQDAVAEVMGFADADVLMLKLSGAARSIDWASGRFWRRVERAVSRPGRSRAAAAADETDVSPSADFDDQSLVFEIAAAAARSGSPLSRHALLTLAANVTALDQQTQPRSVEEAVESSSPTPPEAPGARWTERTRRAFIGLLGSGPRMVETIEALEQYELFSLYLPEWRHVRSLPQRNAFHMFTVDRHLLQTVANAAELMRDVSRPDLLLVAALLHDIGKGYGGDHTEVGIRLVRRMLPRMGFSAADSEIVVALVQHHLLLSETATRRDLSDPRTAANVADALGDSLRLELLRALTEADSLATGPSAWSGWKRSLIDELVAAVGDALRGEPADIAVPDPGEQFAALVALVHGDHCTHVEHEVLGDTTVVRVASDDRPGLFADIAGVLALHGVDVVGADAWTSADGVAVDQFTLLSSGPRTLNLVKMRHDLAEGVAGRGDIGARLEARIRTYERAHRNRSAATAPRREVLISNEASDSTTMIDVRAPDAPAVLYRLSSTLAECGIDIRSAKVATLGHEVVDVFYVQSSSDGGRLRPECHAPLADRLKDSLKPR